MMGTGDAFGFLRNTGSGLTFGTRSLTPTGTTRSPVMERRRYLTTQMTMAMNGATG